MNSADGHPFVVAHRGASAERPEHTLAAYDLALKEGTDGVECDVRLTRDGHLVCVHDRRGDRTSNGSGLVSEMTLAEMRELEVGGGHPSWRAAEAIRGGVPTAATATPACSRWTTWCPLSWTGVGPSSYLLRPSIPF